MSSTDRGVVLPPVVVVDIIVGYLDLKSIKALRLINKTWSQLCLGPRFKSFIHHQTTDLTAASLQSLMALICHPLLRTAVKKLTVIADVYDPSLLRTVLHTRRREMNAGIPRLISKDCTEADLDKAASDLQWLEQRAWRSELVDRNIVNILTAIFNQLGQIDLIALESVVTTAPHPGTFNMVGDWHVVWVKATQVYRIVMSALAQSNIMVNGLTIYRETIRCAVPSNEITAFMDDLDARGHVFSSGQSIKCFALDLSMRIDSNQERLDKERARIERYEPIAEDNFPGVAHLLHKMPNLESLVLSLRRTVKGDVSPYHRLFDAISNEVRLPRLRRLSLLGIYATSDSLLRFLQAHPHIEELYLEKVDLTSGLWEPVLRHIQEMPSVTRVILSMIAVTGKIVNLRPAQDTLDRNNPSDPDYYCCVRGVFVHRRAFDASAIRQGFQFSQMDPGPPEGSYAFTDFLVYQHEVYGLP
ncbi:hypothetical protein ASPCADRAFT_42210 [Aspergillus carbonarius ITEM 5010]|uniref:F-box domain-containing protein n=1 Tax=Aspergillus carbonarius (strain ITEM 5010) TaxID=602072 RepID=A0A1R3RWZ4_ASPC5|nr:hypothetical protein ASPCADRAFT_42210 [Aspergillus carbonarius ITEM 5010]